MQGAQILIIEDDPIIGADIADRLAGMGYQVLGPEARGEDALAYLDGDPPPDLILMDIQLEGEWDGIETARQVRAKKKVPLIFLTSNSDDATFKLAKQTQPDAFLSKPFRGRDLQHAIELALAHFAKAESSQPAKREESDPIVLQDRIFVKVKQRMVRLFFKDILWVEADDYYCKIVTAEQNFLVTQTLKKFSEAMAEVPELMRVHRSYMVNLQAIEEIGDLYLFLGQEKIPYSRARKEELLTRLQKI